MWPPRWPPQTAAARNAPGLEFTARRFAGSIAAVDSEHLFSKHYGALRALGMLLRYRAPRIDFKLYLLGGTAAAAPPPFRLATLPCTGAIH